MLGFSQTLLSRKKKFFLRKRSVNSNNRDVVLLFKMTDKGGDKADSVAGVEGAGEVSILLKAPVVGFCNFGWFWFWSEIEKGRNKGWKNTRIKK